MMLAKAADSASDARNLVTDVDPTADEGNNGRYIAEPERRLLFAVLSDAIVRFRRLVDLRHPAGRHDLLEAERWLRSEDRSWPCSFVNVCEALDIAPEPLRRAVFKWRTVPVRKRVTRRGLLVRRKVAVTEPAELADLAELSAVG